MSAGSALLGDERSALALAQKMGSCRKNILDVEYVLIEHLAYAFSVCDFDEEAVNDALDVIAVSSAHALRSVWRGIGG